MAEATASLPPPEPAARIAVFAKAIPIFGRRLVPFVVLTVIANVPVYVAMYFLPATSDGSWLTGVLSLICSSLASGAVVYGVVQDLRARPFSIGESVQVAFGRLLPIVGVAFAVPILIALAALAVVVPGVIVACMTYVAQPVCIAERRGVSASISRSAFLTKGYRWPIFSIVLLVVGASVLVEVALELGGDIWGELVGNLITQAWEVVAGAFSGVVSAVLYYELRVAKEGVDIDEIASVFD